MLSLNRAEDIPKIKLRVSQLVTEPPPAVVVGDSINALGVVRSLGKEGIKVVWLTSNPHSFVNSSKYSSLNIACNDVYYEGLLPALVRLGSLFQVRPVLFLTHDFQVKYVSADRESLTQYYQFNLIPDDLVGQLISKSGFFELAKKMNLLTPPTYCINDVLELSSFITNEGAKGCWVVKPFEKHDYFENLFGKAIKVEGKNEWDLFKQTYRQLNIPLIVQSWITGEDRQVCFCLVVFGSDHRCLMSFSGRKIRQFKPEIGNTASAEPYPYDDICQRSVDFFEKLSFVGMGSLEFKFCENRKTFFAIEPTIARTNLQSEIATLNNYNLAAVYYFDVLRNQVTRDTLIDKAKSSKKNKVWVRFWADLKSGAFYYRRGRLSLLPWSMSYLRPMSFAVFRLSDPLPFLRLLSKKLIKDMKSSIKMVFRILIGKSYANRLFRIFKRVPLTEPNNKR